jgi:hypothetical protein
VKLVSQFPVAAVQARVTQLSDTHFRAAALSGCVQSPVAELQISSVQKFPSLQLTGLYTTQFPDVSSHLEGKHKSEALQVINGAVIQAPVASQYELIHFVFAGHLATFVQTELAQVVVWQTSVTQ